MPAAEKIIPLLSTKLLSSAMKLWVSNMWMIGGRGCPVTTPFPAPLRRTHFKVELPLPLSSNPRHALALDAATVDAVGADSELALAEARRLLSAD